MRLPFLASTTLAAVAALAGCGGNHRAALAVGTTRQDRQCTYEAPANVAKISDDKASAELVGPGVLTSICGSEKARVEWDVVKPTRLEVTWDANDQTVRVDSFAGERDILLGACDAKIELGADCTGIAESVDEPADHGMGAAIFGGSCGNHLRLKRLANGSCTVTASSKGLTASKAIKL